MKGQNSSTRKSVGHPRQGPGLKHEEATCKESRWGTKRLTGCRHFNKGGSNKNKDAGVKENNNQDYQDAARNLKKKGEEDVENLRPKKQHKPTPDGQKQKLYCQKKQEETGGKKETETYAHSCD